MSAAETTAIQALVSASTSVAQREEGAAHPSPREMAIFQAAAAPGGDEGEPREVRGRGKKGFDKEKELIRRIVKITFIIIGVVALSAAVMGIVALFSHPQQDQLQCRSAPRLPGPQKVLADQGLLPQAPSEDVPEQRAKIVLDDTQPTVEQAKAAAAVLPRLDAYNNKAWGQDLDRGATRFVEQDVACLTGLPYKGTPEQAALAKLLKQPFFPTPNDLITSFQDVRAKNLQLEPEIDDGLFVRASNEFLRVNGKFDGNKRVVVSNDPSTGKPYMVAEVNFKPLVDGVNRALKPFTKVQNVPAIAEIAALAAPYELGPVNLAALTKATTIAQIRGLENLFEAAVARFRQGDPVPTEGDFIFKVKDALGMARYTQATGKIYDFKHDDFTPITTLTQSAPSIFLVLYQWMPDPGWPESFMYKIQNLYWKPMRDNAGLDNGYGHSYSLDDVREVGFVALQTARGLHGTWSYRDGSATPFQYNLTAEIAFFEQQLQELA